MDENNGDLDLSCSNITSLPSDLYVIGDLDISNTLISELSQNLYVGGSLYAIDDCEKTIPFISNNKSPISVYIDGDLISNKLAIKKAQNNIIVNGYKLLF